MAVPPKADLASALRRAPAPPHCAELLPAAESGDPSRPPHEQVQEILSRPSRDTCKRWRPQTWPPGSPTPPGSSPHSWSPARFRSSDRAGTLSPVGSCTDGAERLCPPLCAVLLGSGSAHGQLIDFNAAPGAPSLWSVFSHLEVPVWWGDPPAVRPPPRGPCPSSISAKRRGLWARVSPGLGSTHLQMALRNHATA